MSQPGPGGQVRLTVGTVTVIDANKFSLDGSIFVNSYDSGGKISRIILTVVPAS